MAEVRWRGVVPSTITPFDADGTIDVSSLERLIDFAISVDVDGVAVNALAGEARYLTGDERRTVVAIAVAAADGRVPILVGLSAADVADALNLADDARSEGANGVVLPVPGRLPRATGAAEAIAEVAARVDLPVMVQDAPRFLEHAIGVSEIAALVERVPNVVSVKIEGSIDDVRAVVDVVGDGVDVWGGDGGRDLLACLQIGAVGVMPGIEVVDALVAIDRAYASGALDDATSRMAAIRPLLAFEMRSLENYVASAKHLLRARGLIAETDTRFDFGFAPEDHAALFALASAGGIDSAWHGAARRSQKPRRGGGR